MAHAYEQGRLNLPFVGIPTFGKYPLAARLGPRSMRTSPCSARPSTSARSGGPAPASARAPSARPRRSSLSATPAPTTTRTTWSISTARASSTSATPTSSIPTRSRATPISRPACGRSSRPARCRSCSAATIRSTFPASPPSPSEAPIHVVQIDAHLDFVDERHGVRFGHGSPMRRAAETRWVTGLTQLGIRNVSSTAREGYEDARADGLGHFVACGRCGSSGRRRCSSGFPPGVRYYVTIDIDGFDPSIAPGTGTPSHGGFLYYEVLEMVAGAGEARRRWWASTWSRWRPTTTTPARRRSSPRRCCSISSGGCSTRVR